MLPRNPVFEQLLSTPEGAEFDLRKTPFFNILCANPSLAKFYADLLRRHGANPSLVRDLEIRSGIFSDPDYGSKNSPTSPAKGNALSLDPKIRLCTHIKVNGVRCGSPALREEVFCYFHQRLIRGVRTPPKSRIHPIAILENEESIQTSLMEIINALVRNHIDVNRARLILRALYIAARNARRAQFNPCPFPIVTEIPQYPDAPASAGPFGLAAIQAQALAYINQPQEEESEDERLASAFEKLRPPQPQPKPKPRKSGSRRIPTSEAENNRAFYQ